jgi:hypothetical protein
MERLERQRAEAHTLCLQNAWPVIEEEGPLQARPVDGKQNGAHQERSYRSDVLGSHENAQEKEKAPWQYQGAFYQLNWLEIFAGTG